MPALNLIYVVKDGVFDCFDLITGFIKKKVVIVDAAPQIPDALQAGCTLVLAAHCNASGIMLGSTRLAVSDYADRILGGIGSAAKIDKVVYFACTAQSSVAARPAFHQLAPTDILTLTGGQLLVAGAGHTAIAPKSAIQLGASGNGWTFT